MPENYGGGCGLCCTVHWFKASCIVQVNDGFLTYLVVSFQKGNKNMSKSFAMENKLIDTIEHCLLLSLRIHTLHLYLSDYGTLLEGMNVEPV